MSLVEYQSGQAFPGVIGKTADRSSPAWPAPTRPEPGSPNVIFIVLTLVKAFYIVSFFMHLGHEKASFKWTIYLPALILIPYLTFIVLTEGAYLFNG